MIGVSVGDKSFAICILCAGVFVGLMGVDVWSLLKRFGTDVLEFWVIS